MCGPKTVEVTDCWRKYHNVGEIVWARKQEMGAIFPLENLTDIDYLILQK
jgi:hypothetical protein